jgi:hypothetical protein
MPTAREHGARGEGGTMSNPTVQRARKNARELGDAMTRIRQLADMTVGDLAELYRELYGEPTRTRNKDYLRKRLQFRLQELASGGLPAKAVAKITELGDQLPERWRIRQAEQEKLPMPEAPPRDPRLPPVGTVLRRAHRGTTHEVTVAVDGFDYAGKRFKTLSAIAKLITGTPWNGFAFFGLKAADAKGDARVDGEESAA